MAVLRTRCGHCDEPLELSIDSQLGHRVLTSGVRPVLSLPLVSAKEHGPHTYFDAF